jgi:hypothetical protein
VRLAVKPAWAEEAASRAEKETPSERDGASEGTAQECRWVVLVGVLLADAPSSSTRFRAMGRLARRTLQGQDVIAEWSDSDRDSYAAAVSAFERELENGYTAVSVEGAEYRPITELPREAELVLLSTAMGGG